MKSSFLVPLLILASVSLLWAQAPPLLINFGPAAVTNTTNDPYHALAGVSTYTTWNTEKNTNVTSGLLYGDGTAATGVSITLGAGTSTNVNFSTLPTGDSALDTGAFVKSPYTTVFTSGSAGTDAIWYGTGGTSQTSIGASIGGLAAGTYDIFLVGVNTNNNTDPTSPNGVEAENFYYTTSTGVPTGTINTSTLWTATNETLQLTNTATWILGNDCAELANVTLTAGQNLNIYGTGAGSGTFGESRGFFNSIEIVPTSAPISPGAMNPANMPSYGAWTSSMIGGGGWIQNVVFTSNPERLYAWVDVGGFYRSDNGGQNWYMEHENLPNLTGANEVRGVVADPRNADRILVACGDESAPPLGIFESTDGGETFTQVLSAVRFAGNAPNRQDGFTLVRDPGNPDVLLAGSLGTGIWRSTDGGDTWTLSGSNTNGYNFTDVKFDWTNPSNAYACAQSLASPVEAGGFFVSNNGGVTWTLQSTTSPAEIAQDPIRGSPTRFYGTFNGASSTVSYSDNGGVSWTPTTGIPSTTTYRAIAAGPSSMVVSSLNGTFYTLASGQTAWVPVTRSSVNYRGWTWATPRTMFGSNVSSISIDPLNASHWFCTDAFAIYQTTDAGADWSLAVDGVEATVIHTLCQDPSTSGRVHLGMGDNAYLNSVDGGTTFQSSWINLIYNVKDVELSPSLPSRVYMVCGEGNVSNQVYISTNSGTTWSLSPMTGLPANTSFNTIAVSPTNSNECFLAVAGSIASGAGGPYWSTDGGNTWTWLGAGLPADSWFFNSSIWLPGRQIATGPGTGAGCAVAICRPYANSIYTLNRTTMQWTAMTSSPSPNAIVADPNLSGSWIISDANGLYRLLNGSLSAVYTSGTVTELAADMVTPGRFAASAEAGILLSTNSGVSWSLLDVNLPDKLAYNALAFAGNGLVVGSGGSGVFHYSLEPTIIVDNTSPGVTTTGTWTASTIISGYYGTNYFDDGNANKGSTSLTWTPTIPTTGSYTVYARWTASSNRATNVPYKVYAANGTSTVTVNQQLNGGTWVSLGVYTFDAGTSGNVLISNAGTNGVVVADAVEFVPR